MIHSDDINGKNEGELSQEKGMRNPNKINYSSEKGGGYASKKTVFAWAVSVIAISFTIFQMYTAYFIIPTMYLRTIHVCFGFTLTFLTYPVWGKKLPRTLAFGKYTYIGIFESISILIITIYILLNYERKAYMIGLPPTSIELVLGVLLILLAIDACRRTTGWIFATITIFTLLYALFGAYLPVILAHKSYSLSRIVDATFLTMGGVYGPLVGVSATYIYLFIIFGTLLNESGGGDFFIKLAYGLTGRFRGGPAKTAIIASSLFGMISGSGMANVASTGQITIPLMKRTGYRPHFAGAIETVSSAGGLIMPPIMGMSIFIMMEILGIPYLTIIKSAIFIAILYYLGIFLMVDFEAAKMGLRGLPKDEIPRLRQTIREGWPFLLPPLILVCMLAIVRVSVTMASFWAVISIPICTLLKKSTRISLDKIVSGFEKAAYNSLAIIGVVSLAGIAVGMVSLTGLGLRLTSIIIELSGGQLLTLLFFAMFATILLGMGLPTVAAYIITSVLVVPALTRMDVLPFVAHMFIFYFSSMAGITPPMAPFAFVAAGIADAPMMKTAITACKLGLIIFIIPFLFVYNPSLLLMGDISQIVKTIITSVLSVIALSCALQGYCFKRLIYSERIYMFITGLLLIYPFFYTRLAGLVLWGVFCLFIAKRYRGISSTYPVKT
jgi:TRAP transporter 4TM/12TM fusion protein